MSDVDIWTLRDELKAMGVDSVVRARSAEVFAKRARVVSLVRVTRADDARMIASVLCDLEVGTFDTFQKRREARDAVRAREGAAMKRALVLLALSGCAVGGSSSMVGRWHARRVVDSTACVQIQAPGAGCEKLIAIGRDLPARGFSSLMFVVSATSYMQQRGHGAVGHGVAFDSYFEYVRGRVASRSARAPAPKPRTGSATRSSS